MAGLVGILEPESLLLERDIRELDALLQRMCARITYESWYRVERYIQPPFAAGRAGLGIINPEPQPAGNEDRSVLVWMDGEIYDYQRQTLARQLRGRGHRVEGLGDAELIAHRYEEMGEACVTDLDGTFAVAIYDARAPDPQEAKLVLAVDREASRPLFFYADQERVLFASTVKAILEDDRVPRKVDERGVIEFFTFRHVLADRTLLQGIRFLPAGHLAVFHHNKTRVRTYWAPEVVEDRPPSSYNAYVEELTAALRRALERQMYDQKPVGEYLSGGLDSRTLVALVPSVNGRFHTFSRGSSDCWDVRFGEMVAREVGSRHHHLELEPDFLLRWGRKGVWLTDGLMTVNDIYMLAIIDRVKPHVDVVFLGNGRADGILGGIEVGRGLLQATDLDQATQLFYDHNSVHMASNMQARVLSPSFYGRLHGLAYAGLRQMIDQCKGDTFMGQVEAFCIQCRWPRSAGWGALLSRTQVETRSPYSDNDFCDLVCRVPARWRASRQMQLAVLKHTRPDLARVPWATTGLPASLSTPQVLLMRRAYFRARREIADLTRGRIAPVTARERASYAQWYRNELRSWLEEFLLDERTLNRGYYDREGVRQLVQEHMDGRCDRSIQFGLLLTFELWNRLFIDGERL